ncbi:MAG: hypothetical protein ABI443_14265 [Chthoniobacterales bacterium]
MKYKTLVCCILCAMPLFAQSADETKSTTTDSLYVPLSIQPFLDKSAAGKAEQITKKDIPFSVIDKGSKVFSLSKAGWPDLKKDPSDYYEDYDDAAKNVANTGLPLIQIPKGDYSAAYILGWAGSDPATSNAVTLRVGPRISHSGAESEAWMKDFVGSFPRSEKKKSGTEAQLTVIRIPFTEAFSQDVRGKFMNLEVTKEVRLAIHASDPCRDRWRPLGLPSGVNVAAITLERSPIQLEVKPTSPGSLFELPAQPEFIAKLQNITAQDQKYRILLTTADGKKQSVEGTIPAGKTVDQSLKLSDTRIGYHPLNITLENNGKSLFTRTTAFGVIPKDSRQYRAESPLGTWSFGGVHGTPPDTDAVGELFKKLGLRYGMFAATPETLAKYGVVKGVETTAGKSEPEKVLKNYNDMMKANPNALPDLMIFHENAISGEHATRVPDLFVDRAPYVLNEKEKENYAKLTELATKTAQLFRKEHPETKIHLGNGGLPFLEEFFRNKFPAELFDTAGNEAASFMRFPETQPPDGVANNASIWMDRQLLDAYGYKDKGLSQCYEVTYPSTNPGNLSYQTESDYFIRNILHSMAWKMPKIRIGVITDVGNSYYYGNWGASGFFLRYPNMTPKPAALAIATITRVLDGAQFENYIETGSDSAYLLQFKKKDNSSVLAYWVVRGSRDYAITLDGAKEITQVAETGASQNLTPQAGKITVTATASPAYLELPAGASFKTIALSTSVYNDKPEGKVAKLNALGSMKGWKVESGRNPLLEFYNPFEPRRKGNFSFNAIEKFEGRGPVLEVKALPVPGKATVPMYVELVNEKGIPLPGKPAEIGMWVNGNSGWGGIIYELEDASGQKWVSIGAKAQANSPWMADWLTPEMQKSYKPGEQSDWNTDDVYGFNRINFDGWRYVGFPLPGQYPGEGYHWPFNSQWYSNKDGIVHYPLTLKKVIVQLPEKTLYLTRFEPAKRPEIYLSDLVSVERDMDKPKTLPNEYIEKHQVTAD